MLRALVYRRFGSMSPEIERLASRDIDDIARDLFLEAVALWEAEDWYRYGDTEPNCTVRMYESLRRVRDADQGGRYWWVRVELEHVAPTRAMLAGDADATGLPRPDLLMAIGAAERFVECKRLSPGGHVSQYVERGLARFVNTYYASVHARGMMIGFIQRGDPEDIAELINERIEAHPDMGYEHRMAATNTTEQAPDYSMSICRATRL